MPRLDRSHDLVGHARGAHLRLQVVGGDLGAGHELALLARPGLLDAAVEEVGDVGVLLGLGDVELLPAQAGDDLGQAGHDQRREGHLDGQAAFVLGQRDHGRERRAVRRGRSRRSPGPRARASSWRARSARKLKRMTTSPSRTRAVHALDDRGLDELVVLAARVGGREGGLRRLAAGSVSSRCRGPWRRTRPWCAPSACRGPCRSSGRRSWRSGRRDARRVRRCLEVGDEAVGRAGRRVAAVEQAVDDEVGHAGLAGQLGDGHGVAVGRMDAAGADEAHQVQARPRQPRPCRTAASRTSLRSNEPSAISASMRGRSCSTGRPAPMLRWPTSLLPICPSGRPTARAEASSRELGHSSSSARQRGISAAAMASAAGSGP